MRIFNPQDQLGKDLARKEELLDVYSGETKVGENTKEISFQGNFVALQKDPYTGKITVLIRKNADKTNKPTVDTTATLQ